MAWALTACVRRCCGFPLMTAVGKGASPITASVVGNPSSRPRAIELRYGQSKRDAILWVSPRGGLLCSCFGGTQNALLISASFRSTNCRHTTLLATCLRNAGVFESTFRARMRLRVESPDFAHPKLHGTAVVWTTMYRTVFLPCDIYCWKRGYLYCAWLSQVSWPVLARQDRSPSQLEVDGWRWGSRGTTTSCHIEHHWAEGGRPRRCTVFGF